MLYEVITEFGLQVNAAGRGSGFIVDPSGIAVTGTVAGVLVITSYSIHYTKLYDSRPTAGGWLSRPGL